VVGLQYHINIDPMCPFAIGVNVFHFLGLCPLTGDMARVELPPLEIYLFI
jgi:hypothetical protein